MSRLSDKLWFLQRSRDLPTQEPVPGERLRGGTFTDELLVEGIIRTARQGGRVEIDKLGIRFYDAAGNLTMNGDTASGDITIVGTFKTAFSGTRWELTTGVFANELRAFVGSADQYGFIRVQGKTLFYVAPRDNGEEEALVFAGSNWVHDAKSRVGFIAENLLGFHPDDSSNLAAVPLMHSMCVRAIMTATQSVLSGANDVMLWDGTDFDRVFPNRDSELVGDAGGDTGAHPADDAAGFWHVNNVSRFYAPRAGIYRVRCGASLDADAAGGRRAAITIRKNAAGNPASGTQVGFRDTNGNTSAGGWGFETGCLVELVRGDYLEGFFFSAGETRIIQTNAGTFFEMEYKGL